MAQMSGGTNMSRSLSSFPQRALLGALDGVAVRIRRFGPPQGLGVFGVVDPDEALDFVLQFLDAGEHTALQSASFGLSKPAPTALSHEALVGVKWRWRRE